MKFKLPSTLPATVAETDALISQAAKEVNLYQARVDADDTLSEKDVEDLDALSAAIEALKTHRESLAAEETAHADKVAAALNRAAAATATPDAEESTDEADADDADGDDGEGEGGTDTAEQADDQAADVVAEAEAITDEAAKEGAGSMKGKVVNFAKGGKADPPPGPEGPRWKVAHNAPGFEQEKIGEFVGFADIGMALDTVRDSGARRGAKPGRSSYNRQSVATMSRGLTEINDPHDLVREIERATSEIPGHGAVTAEALVAAGGWCAPSEQLYDFCDVPNATDLLSLPEITIRRGGVRWPVEPDLSAIFQSYEFFFTEPQLEAVDGNGDPTAIKQCVEVPCPDEFVELRLNAVGYCVEAGILQRQGWPESIEWFLRSLTQEHLRAMSRRSINDVVAGSGAVKLFPANLQVGGTSSVLNSIALLATNLRLDKGLGRSATIEGIAPSWLHEALRADMAMMEGVDTKNITDAQINGWLTARNIALQFVGDWQTRGPGMPGNLSTLRWPGHVDIVLYPAGTWFRSLSNVIEVGVMYPKEQLQVNRYTEFFTEDAIATGKRCNKSVNARIPLPISGGFGGQVVITHTDTVTSNTLTISGGPTGGTYTLTYAGLTTTAIAYNANAATIKAALVALDDGYTTSDFVVTGTGPFTIQHPGGTLTADGALLTGGTTPAATIS